MAANVTPYQLDDLEWRELLAPEMDQWLNSWTPEEQAKYAGQYVAVSRERRVIAAGRTASTLQRTLTRMGVSKARVLYVESPDVHIVYSLHP
jgi:hypothetical protein